MFLLAFNFFTFLDVGSYLLTTLSLTSYVRLRASSRVPHLWIFSSFFPLVNFNIFFFFGSFSLEQRVRGAAVQPERGAGQAGGAEVPPAQGKPQT